MEDHELQARLAALDSELEEGDITQKGYQKRRTLLLAQYDLADSPTDSGHSRRSFQAPSGSFARADSNSRSMSIRPESLQLPTNNSVPSHYGGGMSRASTLLSSNPNWDVGGGADGGGGGHQRPQSYIHPLAPQNLWNTPSNTGLPQYGQHSRETSVSLPIPGMHIRNPSSTSGNAAIPQQQQQQQQRDSYNYLQQQPAYDYNSLQPPGYTVDGGETSPRENTMSGYFSDFTAQGYADIRQSENNYTHNPMNRYSTDGMLPFSPSVAVPPPMLSAADLPPVNYMLPLEPRDVPFAVYDPHNVNVPMSKFDNLASVLRYRAGTNPKQYAYIVLDTKGREMAAISWEKLASRAEKVAQVIRDKSNLYRGDRVALVYRDIEVIEFVVALLGCFIAGVVAVPINALDDYHKLNFILTSTQAHLALTTDNNLKVFQRDLTTQKLSWPRGVEWWKTNEFGSFHPKRKDDIPPLQVPDLAYIDFSRSPTGDLRGVVMSHRTIMHQMGCLSAILSTVPADTSKDTFHPSLRDKTGRPMSGRAAGETLVSYLDPRHGIGMIFGVLLAVYGGQTTVWLSQATATTPGLYANVITRYKATLCLADYPALKIVAYNYQNEPMVTRNYQKKLTVDFSAIRFMLIDALTVDAEFHEILGDRWLRPLGNTRARDVVAPMLCLPEHGGMVISTRDWLGGEERMGCTLTGLDDATGSDGEHTEDEEGEKEKEKGKPDVVFSSLLGGGIARETPPRKDVALGEVLLDKEALKTNEVVVLAVGDEAVKRAGGSGTVRVGTFGYPIPDATLAVVDPETSLLCSPNVVGEIWVDSPSLSGGFWALPKQTESIFHARPYKFEEGNPNPVSLDLEFLRTGLLGCVIEGKIFVLGLYEDRLRQKVEWVDGGEEGREEFRCFFVQHLVVTVMRNIPKIFDWYVGSVFQSLGGPVWPPRRNSFMLWVRVGEE